MGLDDLVIVLNPLVDFLKRLLICTIVDNENAFRALKAILCHRPVPLLSGGVHKTDFDKQAVRLYFLDLNVGGQEGIMTKKSLLCKIEGSKLQETFKDESLLKKVEGKIFVDRDPNNF